MFAFRIFMVFGLTFTPLIHFKLTFMYGVRQWSSFILLQVAVWFFLTSFIKEAIFSPLYILGSFVLN